MDTTFYIQLLIVFALAVAVPIFVCKFRFAVPIVVCEILLGMIFGKSFLGIIGDNQTVSFIADIGFAVLMFLSGLEVDLDLIMPKKGKEKMPLRQQPMTMAWLIFVLCLAGAALCAVGINLAGIPSDIIMITLLLSTTSLGVVVPVLKEKGIIAYPYGQVLLISALIAYVATMLLITIYISWHSSGNVLPCLLIGVLFIVFAVMISLGKHAMHLKNLPAFIEGTGQIMVKISFFVLFGFICLAELLDIEVILGAFIAGLLISIISKEGSFRIREKMDVIGYGVFIPVFFINIGNITGNKEAWILIPILLVISFAIKILPSLLLAKTFSLRRAIAAGTLLSSRLSLIIAAGAIALKMGLITDVFNSSLMLVTILSCTISPLLFNKIYKNEALGIEPEPIKEMIPTIMDEH